MGTVDFAIEIHLNKKKKFIYLNKYIQLISLLRLI